MDAVRMQNYEILPNSLMRASGNSPGNIEKLCVSTEFSHQEIRRSYVILCSNCNLFRVKSKWWSLNYAWDFIEKINIVLKFMKNMKSKNAQIPKYKVKYGIKDFKDLPWHVRHISKYKIGIFCPRFINFVKIIASC